MKHAWVPEALRARGFNQRDLAQRWEVSEGAVSRWLSGQERQDLPMSRAMSLSRMLGIDLEELAAKLGYRGDVSFPMPMNVPAAPPNLPLGTMLPVPTGHGRVRVLLHLDLSAEVAGRLLTLIGEAH